ncbi:hypothetical protein [Flavobacterium columnare]|uniref:Uncharacterized protein n=2 Tax=Flavobacterium TaxID=237 RepID=A0A2N9PDN2_9FLAO|nr:hypothetical protein [Flavobacterium columnare]RVU90229.1 hypothetical protein EH230_04565 [Flavobacterium columnare]SPE78458.1 hypothetical protein FLACOL_02474 [Flavobacterium columnare]
MRSYRYHINLFFLITTLYCFSQSQTNKQKLDTLGIIKLVEKKGLLLIPKGLSKKEINTIPSLTPKITFDPKKNNWTVISTDYKTTQKGDCKKTNGCTMVITQIVVISDITKKIIHTNRTEKLYQNYE